MMKPQYPALWDLFAGYFHQDWSADAENADEVLQQFLKDANTDELRETLAELDTLLSSCADMDNDELGGIVHRDLGCDFNYKYFGWTAQGWLKYVRSVLTQSQNSGTTDDSHG